MSIGRRSARPILRMSRRYSLAGATIGGAMAALILGAPPQLGAQELMGKVQESWRRLESYSCHFVAEGMVGGKLRKFDGNCIVSNAAPAVSQSFSTGFTVR